MRNARKRLTGFCGVLAFALPAGADLGAIDPTWEQMNEIFGCQFSRCSVHVQAMIARPQGKMLLLVKNSYSVDIGSHYRTVFVVRQRNADGSLDRTFQGMDVSLPRDIHFGHVAGGAIDVQADRKVVAAGLQGMNCTPQGYDCEGWLGVVRSLPDGSPDPSFGTNGRFLLKHDGAPVSALRVLPDGRVIVVAGAPYRLTASGVLDTSYGTAGKGAALDGQRVLVLPDGRVLAISTTTSGFTLTRLDAQGNAEGTGSREYPVENADVAVASLVMQGEDMLVAANDRGAAGSNLLIRIRSDGTPDAGFGEGGILRTQTGGSLSLLAIDGQGRIVGVARPAGATAVQWVRWQANGSGLELVGPAASDSFTAVPHALVLLDNSKGMLARGSVPTRYGRNALESNREFVLQQYRDFLSREGDAGGVGFWESWLGGSGTRAQMVLQFLESPEFQGRIAPLMRLYLAYFLRYPDYAGLQFWIGYSRVQSLEAVSQQFANSAEFTQRYGSTTDAEYVRRLYLNVLGREPDGGGAAFWEAELSSGRRTRGQVMLAFSESEEFRASSLNEVRVAMTYAGMLRREPDPGGYAFWVDYLDDGNSPSSLIDLVLGSAEYRARFAP